MKLGSSEMNSDMEMENATFVDTHLPMHTCLFIDVESDGWSCTEDESVCVICSVQGKFLLSNDETINSYNSTGHVVNLLLVGILFVFGILGTLGSALIIIILKFRKKAKVFDTMLIGLASFDLICCVFSVITGVSYVTYFQNWNRGWVTLQTFRIALYVATVARTGSAFMTVAIGIERLVVIAFGINGQWGTVIRTRILIIFVTLFSLLELIGRITGTVLLENVEGKNVPSIQRLDYLSLKNPLPETIEKIRDHLFQFAFWAPLPILLVTYGLIYFYIRKITAQRKHLMQTQQKDINTARMLFPVVFVFLLCYTCPISVFLTVRLKFVAYREMMLIMYLSYAINSAVNLPIYCLKGSSFKREVKSLLALYTPRFIRQSMKKVINVDLEMKKSTEVLSSQDTVSTSNINATTD